MQTRSMHTDSLVTEYVHVVNQALGEHDDDGFFHHLLDLSESFLGDKQIGMEVYGDSPSDVDGFFRLRFQDRRFEVEGQGKADTDITWSVPRDHVVEVVDNARDFIDHPAKLDLDWLERRVSDM